MNWMAWTCPTAAFFASVLVAIAVMTLLELRRPTVERSGWLPIRTTRGDRFFIGLLGGAFIHILWLAVTDLPVAGAGLISLGFAGVLMVKG